MRFDRCRTSPASRKHLRPSFVLSFRVGNFCLSSIIQQREVKKGTATAMSVIPELQCHVDIRCSAQIHYHHSFILLT